MFSIQQIIRSTGLVFLSLSILSACGGGSSNSAKANTPTAKEAALSKIVAYTKAGSSSAPTVQDYKNAGVSGVSSETLDELNSVIKNLDASEVDSTKELESLTSQLGINIAPIANAGADKAIQVNTSVTITGSGTDSDGSIASYKWEKGGKIIATTASFDYKPATVTTETLTLTVTDNEGDFASDMMTVVVSAGAPPPNKAPTANAGGNKTVQVNKTITITGTGADSDGTISYLWKKGTTTLSTNASFNYTPTKIGTDSLTLIVTDDDNESTADTMNVVVTSAPVADKTPPVISLIGGNSLNVEQGSIYTDAGATAVDNIDGNISSNIIKAGDAINTNASVGTNFTITYNISDAAGNAATQITRMVAITAKVPDTTDPVITLKGENTVQVIEGSNYVDAGATANDDRDGNITAKIIVAGDTVNTNASTGSTFTITYNVMDAAGNPAIEITRAVSIIEDPNTHEIPTISQADITNYLNVINTARAEATTCGGTGNFPAVPAVSWSNALYQAAYEHSQDLALSNTFSHDGSGTVSDWSGFALNKQSDMVDRVTTYGYNWGRLSENISAGTVRDTAQEAIDSWLDSPGHCHNMMDANVTEVGMAIFTNQSSTYTNYWTQNFGKTR
ncbi:MAG: immunoglobulin-like domain-containing protein [Methylophilaceae bacterium]